MDAAYEAVQHAPTYLPLHSLMGDLLVQEGRTPEAITKYGVVAQSYSVRGEVKKDNGKRGEASQRINLREPFYSVVWVGAHVV